MKMNLTKCFQTIAIAGLLLLSLSGFSQNVPGKFKAALKLGMNASQINGDDSYGFNKLGLMGGVKSSYLLSDKMRVGLEILYSQRGSQTKFNPGADDLFFKIDLKYIEVPLTFEYLDWYNENSDFYRMHFEGGFSYGRLFSSHVDWPVYQQFETLYHKNDFSYLLGATFFATKHLGIGVRYTRSMNPLIRVQNTLKQIGYFLTFNICYEF